MLLHLINHRIRVRLEASQMQRQRKRFRSISLQTAFSARRNPALSYAEVEINCLAPSGLSLTECAATGMTYTREQQTDNYSPTFVINKTRSEQQQHKRQAGSASRRHRPVMSASPKRARARRKRQIGLRRQESDQVSSAREHYGGKSGCAALQSVRSCVSTNWMGTMRQTTDSERAGTSWSRLITGVYVVCTSAGSGIRHVTPLRLHRLLISTSSVPVPVEDASADSAGKRWFTRPAT